MARLKAFLSTVLISILFLSHAFAKNTEVYFNKAVNFSIQGPEDWFLEMKDHPSPKALPIFQNKPDLFAIFSSYNIQQSPPANYSAGFVFIYFSPPDKEMMKPDNPVYKNMLRNGETLVDAPQILNFNNRPWVVIRTKSQMGPLAFFQITYITVSAKATIHIEALTDEQAYNERRKLFDAMITSTAFEGNEIDRLMKLLP